MGKPQTPTYIVEIECSTSPKDRAQLKKIFNVAEQLYNTALNYALKRLKAVKADPYYRLCIKEIQRIQKKLKVIYKPKNKTQAQKEYESQLKDLYSYTNQLEQFYGYSEYDTQKAIKAARAHFQNKIDSLTAQKLATRAFQAVQKKKYAAAKKVHFKQKDTLTSIENKNNKSGLRLVGNTILINGLTLPLKIKTNDLHMIHALQDPTKYVRLVKRTIRGKIRYFAQLIQSGIPPQKLKIDPTTGKIVPRYTIQKSDQVVGIDPGVSTMAVVSNTSVRLYELAPNCEINQQKLKQLQRKMSRSLRQTNSDSFLENGTLKKGSKLLHKSNRYRKLQQRCQDEHRKIKIKRKQAHEALVNKILNQGCTFYIESMPYKALQKRTKNTTYNPTKRRYRSKKRYGRTLANRAPGLFIEILIRKSRYYEKQVIKINTQKTKASQYNHSTDRYQKKKLSDRMIKVDGQLVQRDLYSAFLIQHIYPDLESINRQSCLVDWPSFLILANKEKQRLKNTELKWYIS